MRFISWLIGLSVLAGVGYGIWWSLNGQAVEVDVASLNRGNLIETIKFDGISEVTSKRVLYAPVAGTLDPMSWNSGAPVVKNETVLTTIAPFPSPLLDLRSRRSTEARLSAAEAEVRRAKSLREAAESHLKSVQKRKNSTTQNGLRISSTELDLEEAARRQEVEAAQSGEDRANYELKAVRAQLSIPESETASGDDPSDSSSDLDRLEIRSPMDGQILRIFKKEGGAVQVGTPLMELGSVAEIQFVFELLSADAIQVRENMQVSILIDGKKEVTLEGRIQTIERAATKKISSLGIEEHRVRIVVGPIPKPPLLEFLCDGFRAEGRIHLREHSNCLKLPLGALFREEGHWFVFRVIDGMAKKTKVDIGSKSESEAIILSGLDEHDLVILFPADRLVDQAKVHIRS